MVRNKMGGLAAPESTTVKQGGLEGFLRSAENLPCQLATEIGTARWAHCQLRLPQSLPAATHKQPSSSPGNQPHLRHFRGFGGFSLRSITQINALARQRASPACVGEPRRISRGMIQLLDVPSKCCKKTGRTTGRLDAVVQTRNSSVEDFQRS